ncbi:Uncharacterised protein [Pseudomonas putida]|nr:Uncharacterised protein [Pseudomonas putida]
MTSTTALLSGSLLMEVEPVVDKAHIYPAVPLVCGKVTIGVAVQGLLRYHQIQPQCAKIQRLTRRHL